MSNTLLARFAQNIFWMARYIERVDNLARILDINETYARETRGEPDWGRVLELYDDTRRFMKTHDKATDHQVLGFYVLDRDNPSSVVQSIQMARENARSIRHLIATEMWMHLNTFYGQTMSLTARDITPSHISGLCRTLKEGCQTFEGIAEGTFFRGSAWHFYNMGKFIERADQTTRVLYMACGLLNRRNADSAAINTVKWNALLRSVAAYHAFRWVRPGGNEPRDIVNFLLYDPGFPRSVTLCTEEVSRNLKNLVDRRGQPRSHSVEEAQTRLEFTLNTGLGSKVNQTNLKRFLDDLQRALSRISNEIAGAYFGIR